MTSRLVCIPALLCLLTGPASAQNIGQTVTSDLDGDGRYEEFALSDSGNGSANLLIELPSGQTIYAPDIAWLGGIGQQPDLSLAPNGSVRLNSMNESIGRSRWRQTLTIAFRNGTYTVAGFTYDWYDTLELSANGTCDLNLLTGRGTLSINGSAPAPIRTNLQSRPVTSWKDDIAAPPECQAY